MAGPARPILIFYHIPSDGDEADSPNAFPIVKPGGAVQLKDVRAKFPLPGTYTFRFKMKFGEGSSVWMDVTEEDERVPLFDGKVVAKVTRVEWGAKKGAAPAQPAAAAPPPVQQRPQVVPDAISFGDGRAAPSRAPPPAPQGGKDDFDMLFG
mmetsp:Transcript_56565/g.148796  ORF Transcript_56565/g.148796 Transcript_56565/m.148796 type:complete len:152 (-) Transcript_56565:4-459(-)